ncbi:MAG TPA: YihY/virulence factor BrkB family protein [Candidatus Dormibacteraeota bacterium]|nr:YihY/virulence factor BrkB family protein [Candidatus Dormibacteraeota bacterium]
MSEISDELRILKRLADEPAAKLLDQPLLKPLLTPRLEDDGMGSIRERERRGLAPFRSTVTLREFLRRVGNDMVADNVTGLAAQMSYYFVLSLFPFLLTLAAVVGMLAVSGVWDKLLSWIVAYLPSEAQALVVETILGLTRGRVGFFSIGLIGTLWAASSGVMNLMDSLNAAYGVRETRSFWKRLRLALATTVFVSLLVIVAFVGSTISAGVGEWLSARLGGAHWVGVTWRVVTWTVSIAIITLATVAADHALPNLRRRWHWTTPGNIFAVLGWVLASASFNFYVKHIATYGKVYGALGVFVILMVWIYILSLITLVGAELNSEWLRVSKLRFRKNSDAAVRS